MGCQVSHRDSFGYPRSVGRGIDGLHVIPSVVCPGGAAQLAVLIAPVPLNVSFVT